MMKSAMRCAEASGGGRGGRGGEGASGAGHWALVDWALAHGGLAGRGALARRMAVAARRCSMGSWESAAMRWSVWMAWKRARETRAA